MTVILQLFGDRLSCTFCMYLKTDTLGEKKGWVQFIRPSLQESFSPTSLLLREQLCYTTQSCGEVAKAVREEPAWVTGSSLTTSLSAASCLIYPVSLQSKLALAKHRTNGLACFQCMSQLWHQFLHHAHCAAQRIQQEMQRASGVQMCSFESSNSVLCFLI